jgi:plastocyanin
MDGNFFFVIGCVLVLAAVVVSFMGIRGSDSFPPNRGVLLGVIALFVVIVGTTMAFAIVKSVDEQDKRNKELAQEEGTTETTATGTVEAIDVSSPADGSLVFTPAGLQAKPGNVQITYDNPSPVPHSIAVATANGNVIGEVQPFSGGKQTLDLNDLKPGKYVFYCTVPGHREAGMEGDMTVLQSDTNAGPKANNP